MATGQKINWLSNAPWAPTGYGQQTALFVPRLRDRLGYDPSVTAFYGLEGAIGAWNEITVYPTDFTRYGKRWLKYYVEDQAQGGPLTDVLVISLMDVWVWLDIGRGGMSDFKDLRMASWVPIDHDPVPPLVLDALATFNSRPIAISKFGLEKLLEAGMTDALYVPHGVDTSIYKPSPEGAAEMKAASFIPEDAFVVGMVANNVGNMPPRKAFPQCLQAFSIFHETHPDSILYLHTEAQGIFERGIDLIALASRMGIPETAIGFAPQAKYLIGTIRPQVMASIYSMMDVLLSPSYGEGFGIPIIEAQACGTPVIVNSVTAMPELCGAGWQTDGDYWWDATQGAYYKSPSVLTIIEALEQAYEARGNQALSQQARDFALGYDADLITDTYWKPVLEQIQGEHEGMRAKPQVAFKNRAQRRAEQFGKKTAA